MVTDSPSDDAGGGGSGRTSPLRYGELFDEVCPWYMSIGMSYSDFWDGDCEMAKFYREKYEIEQERKNTELWMEGAYIYEALLDASPMFRDFTKRAKPLPYRDSPVAITKRAIKRKEELNKQRMLEQGREAMRAMMIEFNKKFEKKGGKVDGD